MECEVRVEKSYNLRKEGAQRSGGTALDTSVLLVKQKQTEQAVAGVDIIFVNRCVNRQRYVFAFFGDCTKLFEE